MKEDLLFYKEYEEFYNMAKQSKAFEVFCRDACGKDFSQDGFSDIAQIDMILKYIPDRDNVHILDVGCGNGKMLKYLQEKTGAFIHGFDYSKQAIVNAKEMYPTNSEFRQGIIGEIEYPSGGFDVITSMDTMYFAEDMVAFVAQIKKWLKTDGVLFVGYQEGDVMPKTDNAETTEIAKALKANGMDYEVLDITRQTYDLLRKKRQAAFEHQAEFEEEGNQRWFDMLLFQTECSRGSFKEFAGQMARYIFIVGKNDKEMLKHY